jgi:protein O-GlcNAc transferase
VAEPLSRIAALLSRATSFYQQRQFPEAAALCQEALLTQPDCVVALQLLGMIEISSGRPETALDWLERLLRLRPDLAATHYNRGNALRAVGRLADAAASYEQALRLQPDFAEALNNLGTTLWDLRRPEESLRSYQRALELRPRYVSAANNLGKALREFGRAEEALQHLEHALSLDPKHLAAWINRGNVLRDLGRLREAAASFETALQRRPGSPEALNNRGGVLLSLEEPEEAATCFARLLEVAPEWEYAAGNLLQARDLTCDWTDRESNLHRAIEATRVGRRAALPLSMLGFTDSAQIQARCARAFAAQRYPAAQQPVWPGERYQHDRIRVAYLSADFREHPVAYCLLGVWERHDRRRFEIIGVSLQPPGTGAFAQRVAASFDQFIDVSARSDREVARLLRELEVDIVVDLMGFTLGMRLGVFAHRAAPVQVSYLGYAGTLGTDYMDYLVADEIVIPPAAESAYAERIVRLPHCYLPVDDRRVALSDTPTRGELGLPGQALVFCAFCGSSKLNPAIFELWCRLLLELPDSVLWLRAADRATRTNLVREARQRGVAPQRLVFAERAPNMEQHLARQRAADLFLDTFPYNAHSTACEALWAGLPVLTCAGNSFASRVAASALTTLRLPELITESLAEYERRALELAGDPPRLRELRGRLLRLRATSPLFDTAAYCRDLESAYMTMLQRETPVAK